MKTKGASAMQPAASALDGQGIKIMRAEADGASIRVNEGAFLRKKESDVPVDQVCVSRGFQLDGVLTEIMSSCSSTDISPRKMRGSRQKLLPRLERGMKALEQMKKK